MVRIFAEVRDGERLYKSKSFDYQREESSRPSRSCSNANRPRHTQEFLDLAKDNRSLSSAADTHHNESVLDDSRCLAPSSS